MPKILTAIALISTSGLAVAETESKSISMQFEDCNTYRANMLAQIGVPVKDVVSVVNTSELTIYKVYLSDGSILISCSRPDRKMVVTRSSDTR